LLGFEFFFSLETFFVPRNKMADGFLVSTDS